MTHRNIRRGAIARCERQTHERPPAGVVKVEHRGFTGDRRFRAASFKGVAAGVDPASVVFGGQQ